jgi:hypothetical protein
MMHTPTSDNLTPGEREAPPGRPASAPIEREVRVEGAEARTPEDTVRQRVESGFYLTPAMADVVARQIVARGDL